MARLRKNKLASARLGARLKNFGLNLMVACGWLVRWGFRLLARWFHRMGG